jgi:hemerythrin-like domain-containing protein
VKRSAALESLSRDHHGALVAAQRLRRATDALEAAAAFAEFFDEHGSRHFRIEEEVLVPMWAKLGRLDERAVSRLALEHARIRALALEAKENPTLPRLHELGEELMKHVRFEERLLFELIERDLDEEALSELASAVERAESRE